MQSRPVPCVCVLRGLVFLISLALGSVALLAQEGENQPKQADPSFALDPPPESIIFSASFSPDSKRLALANENRTVSIHDAASGKRLQVLRGHKERVWTTAFSPDGQMLASCSGEYSKPNEPGEVILWDLRSGELKMWLPEPPKRPSKGLVFWVTFSPDGKTLLSASWDGAVKLWDPATGKEKGMLAGHTGPVRMVTFTPDGKSIATASFDGTVRFWDPQSGKQTRSLRAHSAGVQSLGFSPDGKYLATCSRPGSQPPTGEIKLWELATGVERIRLPAPRGLALSVAYSADGRMVACGGGQYADFGEVKLLEVASGKERADFSGHKEWVECVQFTPDGKALLSCGGFTRGQPGNIFRWRLADLRPPRKGIVEGVRPALLRRYWEELAGDDATVAYQAILTLTSTPEETVALIKERLKPAAAVDAKRLERLLADLAGKDVKIRDQAEQELEKLADLAAPALRKAFAAAPPGDFRNRTEKLLAGLEPVIRSPEVLRSVRAVEVLEQIGNADARAMLKSLSGGAAEARLTREAHAALKRLGR
jgi:WD40 repeat protein